MVVSVGALVAFGIWTAWLVNAYMEHVDQAKRSGMQAALTALQTEAEMYYTRTQTYRGVCESEEFGRARRYLARKSEQYTCRDAPDRWAAAALVESIRSDKGRFLCVSPDGVRRRDSLPPHPSCDPAYSAEENALFE